MISKYQVRVVLSNLTYMMSMAHLVAIGVETPSIDDGYYLKQEFNELLINIIPNYRLV